MKFRLLILYCTFHHLYCEEFVVNLMEYLDIKNEVVAKKLQFTKSERNEERNILDKHVLKIGKYSNDIILDHSGAHGHAKIFNLLGASFVLLNDNLYNVSTRNCCKSVYKFPKVVEALKATEMGDLGLILTIEKYGNVYIHGVRNQNVFFVQSIQHANVSDAVFFKLNDKLYLIISTSSTDEGDSYAYTTLYTFTNTHFDEIERILTVGARKIATFHENDREIIAIFQHCVNREISSVLFEFRSGSLRKIQKFEAPNPSQVLTYTHNRRQYIMVLDNSTITLYWWTGSELFWNLIASDINLEKITNFYETGGASLISFKNNTLINFKLLENEMHLIKRSEFQTNFSKILDVMQIDDDKLAVMGLERNSISIYTLLLKMNVQQVDQAEENSKVLRSCLLDLEKSAYVFRAKLNKILNPRRNTSYAKEQNSTVGAAQAHKMSKTITSVNTSHDHYITMAKYFGELIERFQRIRSALDTYNVNTNDLVFNGTTVLKSIIGDKAEAMDIHLKKVNNKKWNEKGWLLYSSSQRINGKVTAKHVSVKNLHTPWNHSLFQNLVLNSHQVVVSSINVSNLKANDIITDIINGIKIENVLIDHGHSFIFVRGLKRFKNLTLQSARVNNINEEKKASDIALLISNPGVLKYSFANNLPIDNIWIETINGVNWEEFENSVFLIGKTRNITGNLIFLTLEAERARFRTLNGVLIDQLFTSTTNQTIDNLITIRSMFANNIFANAVNDVNLMKSAAISGSNTLIEGPVKVDHIFVRNNLKDKLDDSFVNKDQFDKHIIGTSTKDLRQTYNGKVKIHGSLYIHNLNLSKDVKLAVDEEAFDFKAEKYWTKNTPQVILTHFEAQNGMSAPKLISEFLNTVKIDDYLISNSKTKKSSKFYFENVSVKGNLKLNQNETHSPDVKKIEQDSVKRFQSKVVSGHKTYKSLLKIDRLEASVVNKMNISTHVLKSFLSPSIKSCQHVLIHGSLSVSNFSLIKSLNNVNIPQLIAETVFIDQDRNISQLNFDTVTVQNLQVSKVNNVEMNSDQMKKLDRINTLSEIETVRINGNVTIRKARNLDKINEIDVNNTIDYNNLMFKDDSVYGNITFKDAIKARDLIVSWINDINLPKLSQNLLHNKWNQNIGAPFTFRKIKTRNLFTAEINNISVQTLMDIKNETLQIILPKNRMRISNSMIKKSLSAEVNCDMRIAVSHFRDPLPQNWGHVDVKGNVTLWDEMAASKRLVNNIVTTVNKNIISGTVIFTKHISASNVNSWGKINEVLLSSIREDALLKECPVEQEVTGNIVFNELLVDSAEILGNTMSSTIDSINLTEIQGKLLLINPSDGFTIKGKKVFFQGLQSKNFFAKSTANVETSNIVAYGTSTGMIRHAVFDVIRARNLQVVDANRMNFNNFLDHRLLCKSSKVQVTEATYVFDKKVFVYGHSNAKSINGINIKYAIVDVDVQSVDHLKRFIADVTILGDVIVEYFNGMKISEDFRNAILKNNASQFTGVVKILRPSVLEGNVTADSINGIPFEGMINTMKTRAIEVEAEKIHEIEYRVAEFIKKYYDATSEMDTEFMYWEEATDLQVAIRNTINAQVIQFNDDVLIHIEAEEHGNNCGLNSLCRCPLQYSMQISSEHSINMFPNKGPQRIYTYHDNGIVVNVMSNSISTSVSCRTSATKVMDELSSINWNTIPMQNKTSRFFMHPKTITGYVSAVEFFTLHGKSYIVIGRYYEPKENSHNISTLVFKFSDDKTQLVQIQNIPSIGTWALFLLKTAQGIVLVMRSSTEFENVPLKIFQFDPINEKFELLRTVSSVPVASAVGVVLGVDSLILLADHANLNVLKYNPLYKNYYFYQSIQMDYPISKMSVFYTGDIGTSDPYLAVVMENDKYSIFSFRFLEGWKLDSTGELDGVKGLIPFKLNHTQYLFAPSAKISRVLKVVQHDSN